LIYVAVGAGAYAWTEAGGLDPAAVLEAGPMLGALAKEYVRKALAVRVGRDDLIQAGYLGALRAARTYRPDRGASFLTWAHNKVRDEMRRLVAPPVALSLEGLQESGWDAAAPGEDASPAVDAAAVLARLGSAERAALTGPWDRDQRKAALAAARRAIGLRRRRRP
jgi:DNA-directed RNA polymerase specialized sigma24 family protein